MKRIRRLAELLALLALPITAGAAEFDLAAGPSVTAGERATTALFASVFGGSSSAHSVRLTPIGTAGWIGARDVHGNRHAVVVAGGGLQMEAGRHWFASEQLVATSTRTDALSSRFEFMTSVGWQYAHLVVMVRHISNGHLIGGGKNIGETILLAGVRWSL